jgi:hypothetical protein
MLSLLDNKPPTGPAQQGLKKVYAPDQQKLLEIGLSSLAGLIKKAGADRQARTCRHRIPKDRPGSP